MGGLERFAAYRMSARVRVPLLAGLVVVAVAATVLSAILADADGLPPIDYGTFGGPGADILTGHWDRVFGDAAIQAGPFELVVFGIPFLLGVEGTAGWTAFYIVGGLLVAAALALVVDRLVRPVSPDLAAPLAAASAAFAALTASISATLAAGHPAQNVIPILWIVAALLARRGRAFAAGLVLGATLGWELWGVLGVAVLLLVPRLTVRTMLMSATGAAVALVVTFGGFLLVGPVTMFGYAWPVSGNSLVHLLFPDITAFGWPLRVAQAALSVCAGAVVALVLRPRREAVWLVPLAVCGVRLLTDPVLYGYYFRAPALLCLAGLALAIALRSRLRILAAFVLLDLALVSASFGWFGPALLVAGTVAVVVLSLRTADVLRDSSPPSQSPDTAQRGHTSRTDPG